MVDMQWTYSSKVAILTKPNQITNRNDHLVFTVTTVSTVSIRHLIQNVITGSYR